jgi:hypothetical protein
MKGLRRTFHHFAEGTLFYLAQEGSQNGIIVAADGGKNCTEIEKSLASNIAKGRSSFNHAFIPHHSRYTIIASNAMIVLQHERLRLHAPQICQCCKAASGLVSNSTLVPERQSQQYGL